MLSGQFDGVDGRTSYRDNVSSFVALCHGRIGASHGKRPGAAHNMGLTKE